MFDYLLLVLRDPVIWLLGAAICTVSSPFVAYAAIRTLRNDDSKMINHSSGEE